MRRFILAVLVSLAMPASASAFLTFTGAQTAIDMFAAPDHPQQVLTDCSRIDSETIHCYVQEVGIYSPWFPGQPGTLTYQTTAHGLQPCWVKLTFVAFNPFTAQVCFASSLRWRHVR